MGNVDSFQKTILYVDDQPSHRALFLKAFQGKYDIVTAASGEEGIEIIKKNKISLIIADHNMPGMSGIDFLEKAQKMNPAAEKAILSAYLDPVFADSKFALSFDMQINDKETSWKRNNIHKALKVETAHG